MTDYQYRIIGKLLVYIGMIMLLFPIIAFFSEILITAAFLLFGFIIAFSGATIQRNKTISYKIW